jgi:hypothetical protein
LATSFCLSRPSSGQYLQKLKNAAAYYDSSILWDPIHIYEWDPIKFNFCKYWPGDDLLRPKLVANNRNNKIKR